MNNVDKSVLYIVATPIGNLGDITYRAVDVLSNVDVVLAEDTRVTAKLLASLNIRNKQRLVSCHNFNEESRVQQVKDFLDQGDSVALVSDAGTPLISDPGYKVVSELRKDDYKIVPIAGVSAVITALSAAGLPSDNFMFKGFLSAKKAKRKEQIVELKQIGTTVVLYESVHRIIYLLEDLCELIPEANLVVAKELTKQFEKFISGTAHEVKSFFENNQSIIRGEFVVLIDCAISKKIDETPSLGINVNELLQELLKELPLKKAVATVVKLTKAKKNIIYNQALKFKNSTSN